MSRNVLIVLPMAALLASCVGTDMPTAQEGRRIYADNCTACHGYRAEGGTLAGGNTAPDLTRIAARNGGSVPRAEVLSQIDGYHRNKVPEDVMPRFGDLMADEELVPVDIDGVATPTPRSLAALLAYLESIQVP